MYFRVETVLHWEGLIVRVLQGGDSTPLGGPYSTCTSGWMFNSCPCIEKKVQSAEITKSKTCTRYSRQQADIYGSSLLAIFYLEVGILRFASGVGDLNISKES